MGMEDGSRDGRRGAEGSARESEFFNAFCRGSQVACLLCKGLTLMSKIRQKLLATHARPLGAYFSPLAGACIAFTPLLPACGSPGAEEDAGPAESIAVEEEPLLGESPTMTGCTITEQLHLRRSLYAGSFVARSAGFAQCIDMAMRDALDVANPPNYGRLKMGPYVPCSGNKDSPGPRYTAPSLDERIRQVIFAATSTNDVSLTCSDDSETATAAVGDVTTSRNGVPYIPWPETIRLGAFWRDSPTFDNGAAASPTTSNAEIFQEIRAETARTLWHEGMHQWGYRHTQSGVEDCGAQKYEQSVPEIVGRCMKHVMLSSLYCPNDCSSGMRRVYSPGSGSCQCTVDPTYEVGVVPDVGVSCPGEELSVYMDDEDDGNLNRREGWIGQTASNNNTRFKFCRVPGNQFHRPRSSSTDANYAVVRMGRLCPNGSIKGSVYWDNEDSDNENGSSGHVAPSQLTRNTRLEVCIFPASSSAESIPFPTTRMPARYGVFGFSALPNGIEFGYVLADGEHTNNQNSLATGGVSAPFVHFGSGITLGMARVR
jgi:hypothetical protein